MLRDNMSEVARVVVTFDENLDEASLREMVRQWPVWVVGSAANRATAQRLWPNGRVLQGSLCFFTRGPSALLSAVSQIDEHMEDVAWDQRENELEVTIDGEAAQVEADLATQGFTTTVSSDGRKVVGRRPPIRRPA
jgi:hypothetical protein